MAALTVADVKRRIKRKFGDEAGVQLTDSDIIDYINDAQREIVSRNSSLFETSAVADSQSGIQSYNFPSDLLKFTSLSYRGGGQTAYNELQGLSVNELNMYIDSWDSSTDMLGVPTVYAIYASTFRVFPIPQDTITGAFKLYYTKKTVDVSLDADVISLPELYHETVINIALTHAYEMDENWEAVVAKSNQANSSLNYLKSSDEWQRREFYPTISVRPEDL